jgi:hypothetical protein
MKKLEKTKPPNQHAKGKHPAEIPGTRLLPSLSLSPANLLQIMHQTAGNQALTQILQNAHHQIVRTARRDGIYPIKQVPSDKVMESTHPRYGDWNFQWVIDSSTHRTAMYWVTLDQYKNRQRHILIDPDTMTPIDYLGGDLSHLERTQLLEWAKQLMIEQLTSAVPTKESVKVNPSTTMNNKDEDHDESKWAFLALLGDDDPNDQKNLNTYKSKPTNQQQLKRSK